MIKRFLIKWCLAYLQKHALAYNVSPANINGPINTVTPGATTFSVTYKKTEGTAFVFFFRPRQLGEKYPRVNSGAQVVP